jgi:hypothetical protein
VFSLTRILSPVDVENGRIHFPIQRKLSDRKIVPYLLELLKPFKASAVLEGDRYFAIIRVPISVKQLMPMLAQFALEIEDPPATVNDLAQYMFKDFERR